MHAAAKGHACRTDSSLDGALWVKSGCIVTEYAGVAICRLQVDDDFVACRYDRSVSQSDLSFCAAPGLGARGVQTHTFEHKSLQLMWFGNDFGRRNVVLLTPAEQFVGSVNQCMH